MAPSYSRMTRDGSLPETASATTSVNSNSMKKFFVWIRDVFGDIGHALVYAWNQIPDCFCGGCKPQAPEGISRMLHWLPAGFILLLIALLWTMFDVGYVIPAHKLWSPQAIVTHVCLIMALAAYFRTVFTDPGAIPKTPCWQQGINLPQLFEMKKGGERRFCNKGCESFKPDRSHHCHAQLNRCVLRMDHYCPWMLNCIGFYNHKYFLQFLGYSSVGIATMSASMMPYLFGHNISLGNSFLLTQGATMSTAIGLMIVPFFAFHLYLTSQNMTTIEFCEQQSSDGKRMNIYDLGCFHNFRAVLGSNPALWIVPVPGPMGDGIKFEIREDFDQTKPVPRYGQGDGKTCCNFEDSCTFLGIGLANPQDDDMEEGPERFAEPDVERFQINRPVVDQLQEHEYPVAGTYDQKTIDAGGRPAGGYTTAPQEWEQPLRQWEQPAPSSARPTGHTWDHARGQPTAASSSQPANVGRGTNIYENRFETGHHPSAATGWWNQKDQTEKTNFFVSNYTPVRKPENELSMSSEDETRPRILNNPNDNVDWARARDANTGKTAEEEWKKWF